MSIQELQNKNNEMERQLKEIKQLLSQKEQSLLLPAFEKFNFKRSDWDSWIRSYERYRSATRLNQLSETQQINQLLLQMGSEVEKIFYAANTKQEDFRTYGELKLFFIKHYEKKTNVIYERAKFNQRYQKEGETAEEYITDLLKLVKNCKYGDLSDELVRDRLVVGITDRELSERLQMDIELTMQRAVERVQQAEAVKQQSRIMRQEATIHVQRVYRKEGGRQRKVQKYFRDKGPEKEGRKDECTRCGAKPIHPVFKCPAGRAKCHKCRKVGHYERCCKTKRQIREAVEKLNSETESSLEDVDLEVGSIQIKFK